MNSVNLNTVANSATSTVPVAPVVTVKSETSKPVTQKTDSESVVTEAAKTTVNKHVLTFIGNGVWYDEKNDAWHRDNESIPASRTYTDNEYKDRKDLQFMVKYGAMKEQIV